MATVRVLDDGTFTEWESGQVGTIDRIAPRLSYLRFADVVARAHREVLREFPEREARAAHVIAYSVDASMVGENTATIPPWGETLLPRGPISIWQMAYEMMEDQENYYRQIKDVIRHELRHVLGDRHLEHGQPVAHVETFS